MKLSLLRKMLLYILFPAVLGLSILTWVAGELGSRSMGNQMNTQLTELSRAQASQIDNIMQTLISATRSFADIQQVRDFTFMANHQLLSTGEGEKNREIIGILLTKNEKRYPLIAATIITDTKGVIVGHSVPERVGRDISHFASIQGALQGKTGVYAQMSGTTNRLTANMTTPIVQNDQIVGVLLNLVNLDVLFKLTMSKVDLGSSTELYVYDKNATIIMYNRTELIGVNEGEIEYAQKMLAAKSGIIEYSFEGAPQLGYFTYIPFLDWIVCIAASPDDILRENTEMVYSIIMLGVLIALIVAIIIFVVARGIATPIINASLFATSVAGGNFDLDEDTKKRMGRALARNDEISDLAVAMSRMAENIEQMIHTSEEKTVEAERATEQAEKARKLADEATEEAKCARRQGLTDAAEQLEGIVSIVASASEELTVQIEQSSLGAEEQAARVAETATAIEEMNSTVLEVARSASSSAEITDSTRQKATEGAQVTQKCEDSINQVREDSLCLRSNMSSLAEHAQSINAVMSVISDIADQTNLLALNAAIEAARAGEAGRGFAVVADEVRKLAEKTIASTSDVANAIVAIQTSTEINVKQVDTTVQRIEEATKLARASGEALRGILEMADLSADGVRAIATASEEQSATSDEIAQSILQVNTIANDTSLAMGEATIAVAELATQSQALAKLIDNLKKD